MPASKPWYAAGERYRSSACGRTSGTRRPQALSRSERDRSTRRVCGVKHMSNGMALAGPRRHFHWPPHPGGRISSPLTLRNTHQQRQRNAKRDRAAPLPSSRGERVSMFGQRAQAITAAAKSRSMVGRQPIAPTFARVDAGACGEISQAGGDARQSRFLFRRVSAGVGAPSSGVQSRGSQIRPRQEVERSGGCVGGRGDLGDRCRRRLRLVRCSARQCRNLRPGYSLQAVETG